MFDSQPSKKNHGGNKPVARNQSNFAGDQSAATPSDRNGPRKFGKSGTKTHARSGFEFRRHKNKGEGFEPRQPAAPQLTTEQMQAAVEGNVFTGLGLSLPLVHSLQIAGFTQPTDVQAQSIPLGLAGDDLMVSASTGSGKTLAFMLPALHRISARREQSPLAIGQPRHPQIIVLAPTRELAQQVAQSTEPHARALPNIRICTIVGGMPYPKQISELKRGVDVLIGTPGRVLDHLRSGLLKLSDVQVLVLDEADRMLDMGFIDDIRLVAQQAPASRQTLLFSATLDGQVADLAKGLMKSPKRLTLATHRDRHVNITQNLHYVDDQSHKHQVLTHVLTQENVDQAIVFTSTQRDAEFLADKLRDEGHRVGALHGGMPQGARNRTLTALREARIKVLIATDVAARGIDVPTISHVVNYGLPMSPEDYVHRIGRTGRAGRDGVAVSLIDPRETGAIRRIERFTTHPIAVSVIPGLEPKRKVSAAPARGERGRSPGKRYGSGSSGGYAANSGFGGNGGNSGGGKPSFGKPAFGKPAFGKPAFGKPAGERSDDSRKPFGAPKPFAKADAHGERGSQGGARKTGAGGFNGFSGFGGKRRGQNA